MLELGFKIIIPKKKSIWGLFNYLVSESVELSTDPEFDLAI
jgi:hypothetical protein